MRWKAKPEPDNKSVERLSKEINVNKVLSGILVQRGITNFDEAKKFFRPQKTDLHDPFLMKDMLRAVERVEKAILNKEKILIYGDYDVDGTTAVALVYSFFKNYTHQIDYYIPDRYSEGYGISFAGIDYARNNGISLVIALDCGIKAIDKIEYANKYNIDFVICDHHLPGETLPQAYAILNPKQSDCKYPFKELSGCGIGFKLIDAYCKKNQIDLEELYKYIDLVAVSIASDLVPILDENRVMAYYGLKKLKENPNIGLKALLETYTDKPEYSVNDIVFFIGPRINAAGRIADAKESVRLMIETDAEEARKTAKNINEHNNDRRNYDQTITEHAFELISQDANFENKKTTVLFHSQWHKGVIGIVASRLIEKYYRPTVILTESNGLATGSARSVDGFDLYKAIEECSFLLEQYGGHTHAAGLTLKVENVPKFTEAFEEVVSKRIKNGNLEPEIEYDFEIPLRIISNKFYNILKQFAPFGPGNMNPVFMSKNVWDVGDAMVVGNNHLKLTLTQEEGARIYKAIAFGFGHYYEKVSQGISFDICYTIEENHFNGHTNIQLNIKDMNFKN